MVEMLEATLLNALAKTAKLAFAKTKQGRADWLTGTFELARSLNAARKRLPADQDFSKWLRDAGLHDLSKDDRAALLKIDDNAEAAREFFVDNDTSWSWRMCASQFRRSIQVSVSQSANPVTRIPSAAYDVTGPVHSIPSAAYDVTAEATRIPVTIETDDDDDDGDVRVYQCKAVREVKPGGRNTPSLLASIINQTGRIDGAADARITTLQVSARQRQAWFGQTAEAIDRLRWSESMGFKPADVLRSWFSGRSDRVATKDDVRRVIRWLEEYIEAIDDAEGTGTV